MGKADKNKMSDILKKLEALENSHIQVAKEMLGAGGGSIFPLDFFALGIIQRSLLLVKGFCGLVRSNNFTSAAPLIRLQLDNLLQMYAAFIAKDPHDFAMKKLEGKPTNKLKDKNGNEMKDSYLAKQLSKNKKTSWARRVYKETSRFIHFSDKHIFSTVQSFEGSRTIKILISASDKEIVPERAQLEAVKAMNAITNELFRYLYGWIKTKHKKGENRK